VRHGSFIKDMKRDLQKRPTKEICLREMSHVHAGKETFKRDLNTSKETNTYRKGPINEGRLQR